MAALAATLLMHALLAAWLLAHRPESTQVPAAVAPLIRLPVPPAVVPPPPVPPRSPAPVTTVPEISFPPDRAIEAPAFPDWHAAARAVAGAIRGQPQPRAFGEMPRSPEQPPEDSPPSIFEKPLPRVGTTVTTPEGETILWVSDHCYISLGSHSLTMQDFHAARQGIRRCEIGIGRRKPRSDLFDHLRKPVPAQQEPGCRPVEQGGSCGP